MLLPLVALLLAAPPESSPATRPTRLPTSSRGSSRATWPRSGIRRFPLVPRRWPRPRRPRDASSSGRLDPVFTGTLAAPRAEFEAGRYERTVQLLARAEDTPQVRYLRDARPAEGAPHRRRRRGAGDAGRRAARHRRSLPARGGAGARGARATWTPPRRLFALRAAHLPRLPGRPVRAGAGAPAAGGHSPPRPRRIAPARQRRLPALGTRRRRRGAGHPGRSRPGTRTTPTPSARRCSRSGAATRARRCRPRPSGGSGSPARAWRRRWRGPRRWSSCTGTSRGWTCSARCFRSCSSPIRSPAGRAWWRGGRCARSGATPRSRRCSRRWCARCTDPDLRVRALYLLGDLAGGGGARPPR